MSETILLQPGMYYHIYDRGNNRENIFHEERNYHHFLKLCAKYIEPVAETYAYCLLRNHFHFLVKIRDQFIFEDPSTVPTPSQAFSNLFNAYARAFNRAYQRTGALFQRPFGRILVASNAYLIHLVTYIHHNSQKHGFVSDFREWPYSSYHAIASSHPTRISRGEVLTWFEGTEYFQKAHFYQQFPIEIKALVPDDFD